MSKKHLFHLLTAIALVIVAAFAFREAVAETDIRSRRVRQGEPGQSRVRAYLSGTPSIQRW